MQMDQMAILAPQKEKHINIRDNVPQTKPSVFVIPNLPVLVASVKT